MVTSDYDCLNRMNTTALDKYNQMHRKLQNVNNAMRKMNDANSKYSIRLFDLKIKSCFDCYRYKNSIDSYAIK